MVIRVKEKTIEEIESKLQSMNTDLNKIAYLESALKIDFIFEIKRFIWETISRLYEDRKMYDKSGRAMVGKANIDITFREKIESYLKAGELYAKAGKVDDSEQMFIRALRDASESQKQKIKLAMKNIFLISAQELEKKDKKLNSTYFYEKLVKMPLDSLEKQEIKNKLILIYKSLGKFREARLLEGI